MRRLAIAAALILVPVLVLAGATWSADPALPEMGAYAVKALSSGTVTAPTDATAGVSLRGVTSISVYAEAESGNMSAGRLDAYVQNPSTGTWARTFEPDYALSTSAVAARAYLNIPVHSGSGRISFEPSGVGSVTLYIQAHGN